MIVNAIASQATEVIDDVGDAEGKVDPVDLEVPPEVTKWLNNILLRSIFKSNGGVGKAVDYRK